MDLGIVGMTHGLLKHLNLGGLRVECTSLLPDEDGAKCWARRGTSLGTGLLGLSQAFLWSLVRVTAQEYALGVIESSHDLVGRIREGVPEQHGPSGSDGVLDLRD